MVKCYFRQQGFVGSQTDLNLRCTYMATGTLDSILAQMFYVTSDLLVWLCFATLTHDGIGSLYFGILVFLFSREYYLIR